MEWKILLDIYMGEVKKTRGVFSTIRYLGFSSSIKCIVCHRVGGRRHTPVVCNERRKPQTSHYPSNNKNQPTKYSHQPLTWSTGRKSFEKSCNDQQVYKKWNKFLQTHLCPHCSQNTSSIADLKSSVAIRCFKKLPAR